MNQEMLNELASNLPEELKGNAESMVETMFSTIEGIGDKPIGWHPTNLKIVQSVSDMDKMPAGASQGDMVLGDRILPQGTKVIPLRVWDVRQMWDPDTDNNRMLCNSMDTKTGFTGVPCHTCQFAVFDEQEKKSACNKVKVVLAVLDDLSETFLINFSKTAFSIGKDWASEMAKTRVEPYKRVYTLKTDVSAKSKKVKALVIEKAGITEADKLPFLKACFTKHGDDRKNALAEYQEYHNSRPVTQIANQSNDADTKVIEVLPPEDAKSSDMTKRYAM